MIEQDYPDTPEGVRRLLADESTYTAGELDNAQYRPDPYVAGAWLVTLPDGSGVLAYVAGHPLAPDFEEVDGDEEPARADDLTHTYPPTKEG